MAKRIGYIMDCMQWYHWAGVATVIGTGVMSLCNRRTLDKIHVTLKVLQNYHEDKEKRHADILQLMSGEINTLAHHDQAITEQDQTNNEVKEKVEKVMKSVQDVDGHIETMCAKVEAVEKKAGGVSTCKRKITNMERSLCASLESCGLQISNVSQQMAAFEAIYSEQIESVRRDMIQYRNKIEEVDRRITDLERDRSFFSVLRGGDLNQVEQLLNQATLPISDVEYINPPSTPRADSDPH